MKLNYELMPQVLVSGRAIRPYINTRMPQYGTENVEPLIPLFQELDELPPIDLAPIGDPQGGQESGDRVGRDRRIELRRLPHLSAEALETMPRVDLTEMAERLSASGLLSTCVSANTQPRHGDAFVLARRKSDPQEILGGDTNLQSRPSGNTCTKDVKPESHGV